MKDLNTVQSSSEGKLNVDVSVLETIELWWWWFFGGGGARGGAQAERNKRVKRRNNKKKEMMAHRKFFPGGSPLHYGEN